MQVFSDSIEHDFYAESMRVLKEEGIPFLVGGAFALRVYTGVIRDTKDFDLMVLPEDVDRILRLFREAGYRAEITFSHWLAKVHQGESFIDIIYNSGNGVCPVDRDWINFAREAQIFGQQVRICPPEEIIWQKAYIMERERFDGGDVIHLIRSCSERLDWERLLTRFGPDWRVLLSHLVLFGFVYPSERSLIPAAVLEGLLARVAEESKQPDPQEKVCRGPLISRAQYLPDVERWGFRDARLDPRCSMTPDEIEAWTGGIEKSAFRP